MKKLFWLLLQFLPSLQMPSRGICIMPSCLCCNNISGVHEIKLYTGVKLYLAGEDFSICARKAVIS